MLLSPCAAAVLLQVGRKLARVGMAIENHYGKVAQDIEGAIVTVPSPEGTPLLRVVVVQTRPQM